jgi:hypothetical protein
MEEFQEADVLWPDAAHQRRHPGCHVDQQQQPGKTERAVQQRQSPVRIPAAALSTSRHSQARSRYYDNIVDEGGDDGDGMIFRRASSGAETAAIVPPHVLAARRSEGWPRRCAWATDARSRAGTSAPPATPCST